MAKLNGRWKIYRFRETDDASETQVGDVIGFTLKSGEDEKYSGKTYTAKRNRIMCSSGNL
jgi:hypothetical protein